jgi:predicted RNA-binding Zn-ribbon protein involved in translation (DUF1610 family)
MFDTVRVPCPMCGLKHSAQSKGVDCSMSEYEIDTAPSDVLSDVNRHAPFRCVKCGTLFEVVTAATTRVVHREL